MRPPRLLSLVALLSACSPFASESSHPVEQAMSLSSADGVTFFGAELVPADSRPPYVGVLGTTDGQTLTIELEVALEDRTPPRVDAVDADVAWATVGSRVYRRADGAWAEIPLDVERPPSRFDGIAALGPAHAVVAAWVVSESPGEADSSVRLLEIEGDVVRELPALEGMTPQLTASLAGELLIGGAVPRAWRDGAWVEAAEWPTDLNGYSDASTDRIVRVEAGGQIHAWDGEGIENLSVPLEETSGTGEAGDRLDQLDDALFLDGEVWALESRTVYGCSAGLFRGTCGYQRQERRVWRHDAAEGSWTIHQAGIGPAGSARLTAIGERPAVVITDHLQHRTTIGVLTR